MSFTWIVKPGILRCSMYDLKVVSVQVEWVFSSIIVVEHYLHDIASIEHMSVCVITVYSAVGGLCPGGEDTIQRGHYRCRIRDVIEERTEDVNTLVTTIVRTGYILICAIPQVVHCQVEIE